MHTGEASGYHHPEGYTKAIPDTDRPQAGEPAPTGWTLIHVGPWSQADGITCPSALVISLRNHPHHRYAVHHLVEQTDDGEPTGEYSLWSGDYTDSLERAMEVWRERALAHRTDRRPLPIPVVRARVGDILEEVAA